MNRLKRVKKTQVSGLSGSTKELKILNIITLLLLSVYNVIVYILYSAELLSLVLNIIVFSVSIALLLVIKKDIVLYIVYLLIGTTVLIASKNAVEYSGIIYFAFACGLYKDIKYLLTSFTLAFISISIRLTILSNNIPVTIQMLLLFCFLSATLYLIFFRTKKRRVDLWREISEKDKAILKLFMHGKDYLQISKILNITDKKDSIRTAITRCRKLSGCDNDIQFGIWLSDKG